MFVVSVKGASRKAPKSLLVPKNTGVRSPLMSKVTIFVIFSVIFNCICPEVLVDSRTRNTSNVTSCGVTIFCSVTKVNTEVTLESTKVIPASVCG